MLLDFARAINLGFDVPKPFLGSIQEVRRGQQNFTVLPRSPVNEHVRAGKAGEGRSKNLPLAFFARHCLGLPTAIQFY